jgi:hypothetical protein
MTQYGFEWNGHLIERMCSDEKKGWVIVGVTTKKQRIQIYITKTGKVRVFDSVLHKELK